MRCSEVGNIGTALVFWELTEPRNAGEHRTASKRALLKAIEDAGGKW